MPAANFHDTTIDTTQCPICGEVNRCAVEIERETGVPQDACWCMSAGFSDALLASVPQPMRGLACICARCAAASSGVHSKETS